MLRFPLPAETRVLLSIATETGLFAPEEAATLLGGVLDAFHAGQLGEGHVVQLWTPDREHAPVGWVYFAPDSHAEGVWNLWWIGVSPPHHGRGAGQALLDAVESAVASASGRLLVIETSALPSLARARAFYRKRGYAECGRVPDFYGVGDDKVIFAKRTLSLTET